MFRRSLFLICALAMAVCFGCDEECCKEECAGGAGVDQPIGPAQLWQPTGGVTYIAGECDRPESLQSGLIFTDPITVTPLPGNLYDVALPNGCSALFRGTGGGMEFDSAKICTGVAYQVGPADQIIVGGSLAVSGSEPDEADFSVTYTVFQDLSSMGGPEASECTITYLFTEVTKDAGPAPLETVATFAAGDFIESVERDADGNTWVMSMNMEGTANLTGVYKIPDGGVPELVSDYGTGFAGNIVFDGDVLYGTYSDAENKNAATNTRQVIEIDTVTGDRTVVAELPDDSTPNGITLDTAGNIYVADSEISRILKVAAGEDTATVWAEGGPLAGMEGRPGVNGLKVFENALYVSNSASLTMLRIPIQPNGSAGTVAQISMGVIVDDFALDVDGNIWATTHPLNSVVMIRPDGSTRLVHDYQDAVWGPTSAVFGVAPGDDTTLYVVNDGNWYGAVYFPPFMQQSPTVYPATVQRVDVGEEGAAVPGEVELGLDSDGDDVADVDDNCPDDPNPGQEDGDSDGVGDACDNCPDDENPDQEDLDGDDTGDACDPDIDGDGAENGVDNCPTEDNPGQEDTDGDGAGDVCDPCPDDPLDECGTGGPTLIPAALLSVPAGCVTYIGAHPVVPEHPTEVVEYVFCSDGTAEKRWNPDPSAAIPGPTDGTGTWSYSGNELTISTTASVLGNDMITVETYGVACTYNDGARLDWYSVAQTAPGNGSTIVGSYASQGQTSVTLGALLDFESQITREMNVTDGDPASWAQTETQVNTCTGSVCAPEMNGTFEIPTSGTIPMPGQLLQLGSTYILQVDDTLVLERQP